MQAAKIIEKITIILGNRSSLTDEDYEEIRKETEEEERKIKERQKISHEEMNKLMDI